MRCLACDKRLTKYEATLKSNETKEYLQLCNKCLDGLDIEVEDRPDLLGNDKDDST